MAGMPSARGLEWRGRVGKGGEKPSNLYAQNFDRIDWNKKEQPPMMVIKKIAPSACRECACIDGCDVSCSYMSKKCKERLGIDD